MHVEREEAVGIVNEGEEWIPRSRKEMAVDEERVRGGGGRRVGREGRGRGRKRRGSTGKEVRGSGKA